MAEIKLTLTDTTSVSEIANFFKGLDDTQQVRARQTTEGVIELYVRGSSKWHLLTDNLKFGFLVTCDYQAAKEKLEGIFGKNGAIKSMKAPKENLNNSISMHQHDFYVREIKNDFKIAEKVITQQEISKKNVQEFQTESLPLYTPENLTNIVEYLASGFETSPDPTLEFIKFIQVAESTKEKNDDQPLKFADIDYEQVENFAIEWQKLTTQKNSRSKFSDEISPEKTESKGELRSVDKVVAEKFIGKITDEICKKIPMTRVNISEERLIDSSAALIIFDPSSGYDNYSMIGSAVSDTPVRVIGGDDGSTPLFTIASYSDAKTRSEKKRVEAFKIARAELHNSVSKEEKIKGLYTALGTMIENKMKLVKPHNTFTIHLPILNPIDENKLTPDEKAMTLDAFAEHTSKWLLEFPNLRIQVELPLNTKKETIEAAYQVARHQAHASQSVH